MSRLRLEIVKRRDDMKGFVVLPRRWVVERIFSWFGRNRRLAKDFENLAAACQGVGRGPRYTMAKVGKSDCEGTFAKSSGNERDAPKDLYGGFWCQVVSFGQSRP